MNNGIAGTDFLKTLTKAQPMRSQTLIKPGNKTTERDAGPEISPPVKKADFNKPSTDRRENRIDETVHSPKNKGEERVPENKKIKSESAAPKEKPSEKAESTAGKAERQNKNNAIKEDTKPKNSFDAALKKVMNEDSPNNDVQASADADTAPAETEEIPDELNRDLDFMLEMLAQVLNVLGFNPTKLEKPLEEMTGEEKFAAIEEMIGQGEKFTALSANFAFLNTEGEVFEQDAEALKLFQNLSAAFKELKQSADPLFNAESVTLENIKTSEDNPAIRPELFHQKLQNILEKVEHPQLKATVEKWNGTENALYKVEGKVKENPENPIKTEAVAMFAAEKEILLKGRQVSEKENGTQMVKVEVATEKEIKILSAETSSENKDSSQDNKDNSAELPASVSGIISANGKTDIEKSAFKLETLLTEPAQVKVPEHLQNKALKAEPPVMTYTQGSRIIQETAKHITVLADSGKSEMNIQLNPAHLGKMDLKLSIQDGQIFVSMRVENEAVKNLLDSNFDHLRDQLNKQNLNLGSVNVFVGNQNQKEEKENFSAKSNHYKNDDNSAEIIGAAEAGSDTGRRLGFNTLEYVA